MLEDFAVVVLALVIGGAGVLLEIVLGKAAVRPALPDSPQHVGGCASGEDPALPRADPRAQQPRARRGNALRLLELLGV